MTSKRSYIILTHRVRARLRDLSLPFGLLKGAVGGEKWPFRGVKNIIRKCSKPKNVCCKIVVNEVNDF